MSSPSWSETITMDDLVERNNLYYKKFSFVPYTGGISGYKVEGDAAFSEKGSFHLWIKRTQANGKVSLCGLPCYICAVKFSKQAQNIFPIDIGSNHLYFAFKSAAVI